jgi:hypothetical protein
VFGFALINPGEGELLASEDFRNALRAIAEWKEDKGWRELQLAGDGFDLTFTPSGEGARRSLEPAPYVAVAKTWATCTPIVLDRHLKAKENAEREAEIASLLHQACANIGLPEPVKISTGKHSASFEAALAARIAREKAWSGSDPHCAIRGLARWRAWLPDRVRMFNFCGCCAYGTQAKGPACRGGAVQGIPNSPVTVPLEPRTVSPIRARRRLAYQRILARSCNSRIRQQQSVRPQRRQLSRLGKQTLR